MRVDQTDVSTVARAKSGLKPFFQPQALVRLSKSQPLPALSRD